MLSQLLKLNQNKEKDFTTNTESFLLLNIHQERRSWSSPAQKHTSLFASSLQKEGLGPHTNAFVKKASILASTQRGLNTVPKHHYCCFTLHWAFSGPAESSQWMRTEHCAKTWFCHWTSWIKSMNEDWTLCQNMILSLDQLNQVNEWGLNIVPKHDFVTGPAESSQWMRTKHCAKTWFCHWTSWIKSMNED